MSLQVWLPLNGDLKNYGLCNTSITAVASGGSIDTSGKIGQCYSFTDAQGFILNDVYTHKVFPNNSSFSVAAWVYFSSWPSTNGLGLIGSNHYYSTTTSDGTNTYYGGGFGISVKTNHTLSWFISNNTSENTYDTSAISLNQWYHVCGTYDAQTKKASIYLNGTYIDGGTINYTTNAQQVKIGINTQGGWNYYCGRKLNDVRIYDHCLSVKEIKEISKALILHYPMANPYIEATANLVPKSSYNTSTSTGWYQTRAQIVDYNMINEPVPFSVGSKATVTIDPTLHASVGGFGIGAAPQIAIKPNTTYCYSTYVKSEVNVDYVHQNYLYRTEYKADGTTIKSAGIAAASRREELSNGWYRYWGTFTSDAEAAKVQLSFYAYQSVNSSYLIGGCQLEELDHMTAYILGSRDVKTEYDCGITNIYDGTITGTIVASNDTSRYSYSYKFNGTNSKIATNKLTSENCKTISFWSKVQTMPSDNRVIFADNGSKAAFGFNSAGFIVTCGTAISIFKKDLYKVNEWNHIILLYSSTPRLFINGVEAETTGGTNTWTHSNATLEIGTRSAGSYYNGLLSDFRIYATTLSEDDVLELYHTAAWVDNGNNMMAYEFVE